ncbi:CSS motif domain associated with EAL family protein [Ochrobactrum quorumnocens]|uniref:cyclic-guanylate-specific phosphodiesterase n=1 Tax=Ochrobactrum quorumnocens TaxID=271865 RepID=A0A248UBJ2_9HYPH|nr:CSS motif domain associated with EAL family protein [[Ochrobactrum] quorumnocens]
MGPSRRWRVIAVGILTALIGAALPITAMTWVSAEAALSKERTRLNVTADRVIARAIATFDEVRISLSYLQGTAVVPCSQSHIALMRDQTLNTLPVTEIGYFDKDLLKCSSWGKVDPEIRKTKPDFKTMSGLSVSLGIRPNASLGRRMIAVSFGDYNALVLPSSLVDVAVDDQMAVFLSSGDRQIIATKDGSQLFDTIESMADTSRLLNDFFLLAISEKEGLRATVVIPRSTLTLVMWNELAFFLPVGGLIALAFVAAIYWLSKQRLSPHAELEIAVKKREFVVEYQPIIELSTGVCVGAEALVRWKMRDGTFVRPDYFIPLAEETGLIAPITDQIIDNIIADLGTALIKDRTLHIAINVSSRDIVSGRIADLLDCKLRGTNIRNEQIWLEATERGFLDVATAGRTLERVREAGHSVAIDDFGTGYSNLQYLQGLPLDAIKIDKSFVSMIGKQTATSSVVELIIDLTKKLDLFSVAEGVETQQQAVFLKERGVTFAQGWLFAKSLPAKDFISYQLQSKDTCGSADEIIQNPKNRWAS